VKVLVIGSGGREHALAWKIRQSDHVTWLGIAPGNGGTSSVGETVNIQANDIEGIRKYVEENSINLLVIGPEDPLANGLSDVFDPGTVFVFGPSAAAAQIESDKRFAKDLMAAHNIPTAEYRVFNDPASAKSFVREHGVPLVVKACGLAAGKGVFICGNESEADEAIDTIMINRKFGDSGNEVLIEDCLEGPEVSLQVITDGENYITLPPSQDHKRIGEGDTGPNTGGMGAYSPAPVMDDDMVERCGREIIEPTLRAMREAGTPYKGLLYAGLMICEDGPRVLEFNCRFGDPETQAVLPLLAVDLVDLMLAVATGKLGVMMDAIKLDSNDWKRISRTGFSTSIILASEGYPGSYQKGKEITGIPSEREDLIVFHAGTKWDSGSLLTSGGRVLAVNGLGNTLKDALNKSYEAANSVEFEGKYLRRDIGWRVVGDN